MPLSALLYGLTAFTMGLVVLLRGRRDSEIALGGQFYWLSAYGLLTSVYSWGLMLVDEQSLRPVHDAFTLMILISLAASGVVLVRFGAGLIAEAGPLPMWMGVLPFALLIPATLVIAYGLVVILTARDIEMSVSEWSRYLLLLPGGVFAALGFARQWARLKQVGTISASTILLATSAAFLVNAVFSGAIVERAGVDSEVGVILAGVPLETWRLLSMMLVALLVTGSMNVFEVERRQEIEQLEAARKEAQKIALSIRAKTRQQTEIWLDALVNVSRRIASLDEADDVLKDVVNRARKTLEADAAALALYEKDGQLKFKVQVTAGGARLMPSESVRSAVILQAARGGVARRYPDDVGGGAFVWGSGDDCFQAETAALVPLKLNTTLIGALWVGRADGKRFSCTDLIGLGYLADQAVIALEHASMASRLQSLAVIEERSRIAREMHDSLAQILGYLGLETQTLEALVRQDDREAVLAELEKERAAIKSAQADVRENILSLRTTLAGDAGLIAALKEYIEEFGIQNNMLTEVEDQTPPELDFAPLVETQCVRIIQEALTNVRRHAQARNVRVSLTAPGGSLHIRIADDGVGMIPRPDAPGHFGLQTMHERANSIGGSLTILSEPGQGTTVCLSLPLER